MRIEMHTSQKSVSDAETDELQKREVDQLFDHLARMIARKHVHHHASRDGGSVAGVVSKPKRKKT